MNEHRLTSLKFLKSTHLIPVKVRTGGKEPFPEWDPRRAAQEDHSATLKVLESDASINLGALMSGKYVDIDIDCTSDYLKQSLDYFLPRTAYVFGRKSKPKSHRIYALHDDFDRGPHGGILRYMKGLIKGVIDDESYSIEVRGGKPENGLFTVLPGSWREDVDEMIEWSADIDPTVAAAYVKIETLIKAIRLAIVSAMFAPHWVEGVRNDMSLALAGVLWRIRTSTRAAYGLEPDEDAPEGYYVLTEDDAKAVITCICNLAGDDPEDKRSRILNLQNTWRKLDGEAGAKVTGGKVLAGMIDGGMNDTPKTVGKNVVKAMYRLLSDNDAAEQIEKMTEQFVMWYGPGVILDLHQVSQGRITPWMTKEQATNSLGGKKLVIGEKKIPIVNMLFGSTIIQRVMGLTFNPGTDDIIASTPEGYMVNQWRGMRVQPSPQRVTREQVDPFYDYVLNIVCSGNEDTAHWVFAWLADMLQQPHKKPGTALVLVGVQGAGKTFLGERVMGEIIGPSHYVQINNVAKLTDKFNTAIDNRILVQCDEAVHNYQKDVASRLKSIITDENLVIEPKGVNAYQKPNHMHLIFTSNEETAALFIDPSPHERRFTVLKVSPHRATDLKYWKDLRNWTEGNLPVIMRWLLDYKYDLNHIRRPLKTEAKEDLQRVGLDAEVSWILSRMASGFLIGNRVHRHWFECFNTRTITEHDMKHDTLRRDEWPDMVMTSVLEEDFKTYVREHGRSVYSGSVITNIKKVLPPEGFVSAGQKSVKLVDPKSGQVKLDRVRLHSVPTQDQIMAFLRMKYGEVVTKTFDEFAKGEAASLDHIGSEATITSEEF